MIPPKKILYPINLDSKKIIILNRIFIIAKKLGASVDILYINDEQAGYRHPHKTEVDVKTAVAGLAKLHLLENVAVSYHVAKGNLGVTIENYCKQNEIDLIITGHKHHNRLYTAFFDTPEESIIDSVSVPVMVIPKNVAENESTITEIDL